MKATAGIYIMKSSDLSNHCPYGPAEGFEEKGYRFKGWQPRNPHTQDVIIQAFKGDELLEEARVKLTHRPRFGLDVNDVDRIDEEIEALLQRLP